MGCISSKFKLREQASVDDGLSIFPVQISPKMKSSNSSVQYYHRHCVSLTSTSYGFMRVDSPIKSSIISQKKMTEKGAGTGTLTEMYGKLSNLEMDEAVLQNKKQMDPNHKSSVRMNLGSPEYEISESIDVGDMMMGLEEAASSSSSSSSKSSQVHDESIHELASQTAFSTSMKPNLRQIDNQRPDKKKLRIVKNVGVLESNTEMDNNDEEEEEELGKENSMPNTANPASLKPTRSPLLLRRESTASNRFLHSIDHAIVPIKELSPSKPHVMMMMMMMMNKKYSIPSSTPPSDKMKASRLSSSNLVSSEPHSPLFDPELVASYEEDLENLFSRRDWDSRHKSPIRGLDTRIYDPLESFEAKCPPSGDTKVVIYTTTLRGIRKTFEDCNVARAILRNFDVIMDERDVSMHLEFLNELRELMGKVVSVPRIFIKGRYIGGIDEVGKLHEDGKLSELLEGLPKDVNKGDVCDGCGGVRFVPCLECNGSRKVRIEGNHRRVLRCSECNENGLIQCPICT